MSTRDEILRQIRAALATERSAHAGLAQRMSAHPDVTSRWSGIVLGDIDLSRRFIAKAEQTSASCVRVAELADVPAAVDAYLREQRLSAAPLLIAAALRGLPWAPRQLLRETDLREDGLTSVTPSFAAIAETGSIVLLSSATTPASLNFVPAQHIAVVRKSGIVPTMEDVWALLRATGQPVPRTVNVITGPSRTADVEQVVQVGVHGPRRVHLVICENA